MTPHDIERLQQEDSQLDKPELQPQEIPLDHEESDCRFNTDLHATPGSIEQFGQVTILECFQLLMMKAEEHDGIDRLQVFKTPSGKRLWLIDDLSHVTALLPSEY